METETTEDNMAVEVEDQIDDASMESENEENTEKETKEETESDKNESQPNDDIETRDRLSRLEIGSEISVVGEELADEVTVDNLDEAEAEEDESESEHEAE